MVLHLLLSLDFGTESYQSFIKQNKVL